MKATLLFAMLSIILAAPKVTAGTEMEILRTRCTAQEHQIRELKEQLRSLNHQDAEPSRDAAPAPASYVVRAGDCIEIIARHHHCSASALAKANGISVSSIIHPGQKLVLPGSASAGDSVARNSSSATAQDATYKIKKGETYYSISRKLHIPLQSLIAANPHIKPTSLYEGRVIRLRAQTSSSTVAKTATASASRPRPKSMTVSTPAKTPVEPLNVAETPPANMKRESSSKPAAPAATEKRIRSVTIDGEMTYAEFAAKHGTDTARLNDLNGLDLASATVLAKGSELYVPAQP